ncbi:hypothetical protein [Rarobacter incanus]|uniref:Uncharacterized protein n=1 Tax=Rarobacter incanus TaxID=153494 RepID=A0A542SRL0_9MICO|nr:hypothetical protein [Rarobacter incanus]TQK77261.1 hypothetical protein FB389_1980 [Rarobacter incanus]
MASFFGRKRQSAPRWSESWDADNSRIVIAVPLDTSQPANSETADLLSAGLLQAIEAIQTNQVGDSIPPGVDQATVAIRVHPTHRDLAELETQTIEIMQESLGSSIPIEAAPGGLRDEESDDPDQDPHVPQPQVVWNQADAALATTIALPATTIDARNARLLKAAFDKGLAALTHPESLALVPAQAAGAHRFTLVIEVPDVTRSGPKSAKREASLHAALANTKVDFAVTRG